MTDETGLSAASSPPPGWYPDPAGVPGLRWWDGVRWMDTPRQAPKSKRRLWPWVAIASGLVAILAVAGVLVARSPFGHDLANRITSGDDRFYRNVGPTMEPTIMPGDEVGVQTHFAALRRGDVVVIAAPPSDRAAGDALPQIKRVIGLPGEAIASSGNQVLIDGRPISEPYIRPGQLLGAPIPSQRVPAGDVFVLGDDRSDSQDSREYGPVPISAVIGIVTTITAPQSRAGPVRS